MLSFPAVALGFASGGPLLAPRVCSVNGVSTRQQPEPWRTAVLSATGCEDADNAAAEYCWKIEYIPRADLLNPVPPRMPADELEVHLCSTSASLEYTFTFPGEYQTCVTTEASEEACVVLQNRYVHRHVMALTQAEFDEYAGAHNTLRNTSTADGRAAFGHRCLDADEDFHTHDAFVSLHLFSSYANRTSADRSHFLMLQEPAHLAWTMLAQKALRCVAPATSFPFFDPVYDASQFYDGSTILSLLDSPVWGSTRYGGRGNHATAAGTSAADEAYYVTDGRFANFPITQTQGPDYWCPPLLELSGQALEQICRDGYELRGNSIFSVGITMMQPKPASHLEFVSRRPLYYMGVDEVCTRWIGFLTRIEEQVRTTDDIEFALDMASNVVHGFGHECISGKWTHDGRWLGRETYNGNDKAINVGMWFKPGSDEHPCFRCEATRCTCVSENAATCKEEAERWYYELPDDRSTTARIYSHATEESLPQLMSAGCDWPRSGTFDWSATANQDPTFYMHHYYTFYIVYLGLQQVMGLTGKSAIELLAQIPQLRDNLERPGNNLDDATLFHNFVPYKVGQTAGTYHTWRDLLEYQYSFTDFVFEEP